MVLLQWPEYEQIQKHYLKDEADEADTHIAN